MLPGEFDELYRRVAPRLAALLYGLVGERDEAEDITQEAFAKVWATRSSLDAVHDPEAWVRTIAWRIALSRLRRRRTAQEWLRRQPAPAHAGGPTSDRVLLVDALRHLPDVQRTAIVLHHLADLSVAQIAAETGTPAGTIKARLARGRASLAVLLADPAVEADRA